MPPRKPRPSFQNRPNRDGRPSGPTRSGGGGGGGGGRPSRPQGGGSGGGGGGTRAGGGGGGGARRPNSGGKPKAAGQTTRNPKPVKQPPVAWPVPEAPLTPPGDFLSDAAAVGIEFEPGDVERLGLFLALLLDANKTTNLTAITEPGEAWRKHILDALTLVPVIASLGSGEVAEWRSGEVPEPPAAAPSSSTLPPGHSATQPLSVIDIGSGGGVPAIPLAIVMPDVRFMLVEATKRKVEFLRHAVKALKLKNVDILLARAETLGQDHKAHREKYDAAMARALGHLAIVCELCGPLVKPRGVVIAVKGAKADQELEESKKALGEIGLRHSQTLDTPTGKLVLLEKTIRTPRLYPRRDGEPARAPIGVKKS